MLNFCGEARSHLIYLSIAFNQSNGICCFRSVSAYNHRIFRTFSQHACTVAGVCMCFFSPAFSLKVNLPFLFGFYLNIFPFDTVPRTFFFRALMMWLLFWALHFLLLLLLLLLFMCFFTQSHTFCAWNCTQRNRMIRNRKQIMVIYSNVFFVLGCM